MSFDIKCLPFNAKSTVDVGDVTAITADPSGSRAAAPYPPGDVEINGDPWPEGGDVSGDAVLTWAHRIRTAQGDYDVVHQDAASIDGHVEGSYKVEVLIDGSVISGRTTEGLTGTSFTYTAAHRISDDADASKLVQFRITPVNDAEIEGTARLTDSFHMV